MDAVGLVLLNALYGAGANRKVMVVGTGMQWGVGLPLAYLVGPVLGWGLVWMWAAMLLYRGGQAFIFTRMWKSRSRQYSGLIRTIPGMGEHLQPHGRHRQYEPIQNRPSSNNCGWAPPAAGLQL